MNRISKLLCEALIKSLSGNERPKIPAGGDLLWLWFCDLSRTRVLSQTGPCAITFAEIEAYRRLSRWDIGSHHVEVLMAMDREYLQYIHSIRPGDREGVKRLPPISRTPISAALFDSMF